MSWICDDCGSTFDIPVIKSYTEHLYADCCEQRREATCPVCGSCYITEVLSDER